uniref:Large ribosomal subunit protein P2 n=1 Tax=Astyanax mexicanus TaxID=7994 RepID=A0A8B9HTX8_ASTMX
MRYVAAYLLAALSGKDNPSSNDIKKILESVGIEVDETRMGKVVSELNGKKVEDVIAQGKCHPRVLLICVWEMPKKQEKWGLG